MKTKLYILLALTNLCAFTPTVQAQCITASYGNYPEGTFYNTLFDGTPELININCYAGEFSTVHVDAGNTYEFSSNLSADYLTVYDPDVQDVVLVHGLSAVTYQATFTGVVLFFTHVNAACVEEGVFRERRVSCMAPSPCLSATYGQYPATTFEPALCDGIAPEEIEVDCYAGEFSKVNLTAGNTYTFYSSVATDFINISNESGLSGIVYGFSPLVYEATTNQVVRFYTHTGTDCGEENTNRTRLVKCSPTFCPSGNLYPSATYTMNACAGVVETITPEAYAGEYSLVNMEAGKVYMLSSSIATDYITVTSANGQVLMTRGYSPLQFIPTTSGTYRYILSLNIECGVQDVGRVRNISCSTNLGVEEIEASLVAVFPNPATSVVTVSSEEMIERIQVFSIDGKLLLSLKPTNLSTTISLEEFNTGSYFIHSSINGMTVTKNVIKQ
ncbi:MAG: T9SS type A sorting domain-containing protein [Bacteroidota bacterium]